MKERKILTKLGIIFGVIDLLLILFGVIFLKPKQVLAETPDSFLMNELYLFNRDTFNINPNFENGYLMKTTILPSDIESDTQSSFFGWYHSLGYRNLIIPYYGSDNDNVYVVFGIPLNGITASNFQIAYSVDTPTLLDFYLIFTDGTYEEWNTEDYGFNMYIDVSNVNREKNCYAFCWEAYSPDYVPSFKNFSVSDGYDLGYQHGKTTGFESGFNSGYNSGYNAGFQDGSTQSDEVIYDKVLLYNQQVVLTDRQTTLNNVVFTITANDGKVNVNGIADGVTRVRISTIYIKANHIYYVSGCPSSSNSTDNNYYLYDNWYGRQIYYGGYRGTFASDDRDVGFFVVVNDNINANNIDFYPIFIDLTLMYGSGYEPSLSACQQIFSLNYYPPSEETPVDMGYFTGYYDGKSEGINEGINIGETNQIDMGWIQQIFRAIQTFFNIQIFPRVTLGIIVGIPFIISLAWFVIKMFRGGGGGED